MEWEGASFDFGSDWAERRTSVITGGTSLLANNVGQFRKRGPPLREPIVMGQETLTVWIRWQFRCRSNRCHPTATTAVKRSTLFKVVARSFCLRLRRVCLLELVAQPPLKNNMAVTRRIGDIRRMEIAFESADPLMRFGCDVDFCRGDARGLVSGWTTWLWLTGLMLRQNHRSHHFNTKHNQYVSREGPRNHCKNKCSFLGTLSV